MKTKEIISIVIALNASDNYFGKYPIGNEVLNDRVKQLENAGKITFDSITNKWRLNGETISAVTEK